MKSSFLLETPIQVDNSHQSPYCTVYAHVNNVFPKSVTHPETETIFWAGSFDEHKIEFALRCIFSNPNVYLLLDVFFSKPNISIPIDVISSSGTRSQFTLSKISKTCVKFAVFGFSHGISAENLFVNEDYIRGFGDDVEVWSLWNNQLLLLHLLLHLMQERLL